MRLKTALLLALTCVLTSCAEVAYAQSLGPAIGSITTAGSSCSITSTPTNCVSLHLDGKTGAATVQITNTFVGTGQFEVSNDNGTTWAAINGTPPNSTTAVTSSTGTGLWQFNVAGFTDIRVRASAFVSGTMSVVINAAQVSAKSSGGGAVYASGLGTNNVIPKGNGAGQLADSTLVDNATVVTGTEPFRLADGSTTVPAYSFTSSTGSGVHMSSNRLGLTASNGGVGWIQIEPNAGGSWSPSTATIGWDNNTTMFAGSHDTGLRRRATASIFLGAAADVNGVPVAQTLGVQNAITGTDLAGSKWTLEAPLGTGAGAGASTVINRAQILATGTTAQTGANAFVVCETKILSNTSATTTTIATVGLASNSGGGVTVFHSLTATDATNFDQETQSYNVSFVNKAGVITVGTPAITTSTAANNSGTATIGATVTGASPTISLKVTPVYGTIVPSTVTLYTTIINHGAGAVTCQ